MHTIGNLNNHESVVLVDTYDRDRITVRLFVVTVDPDKIADRLNMVCSLRDLSL